jgi:hypothetical protein
MDTWDQLVIIWYVLKPHLPTPATVVTVMEPIELMLMPITCVVDATRSQRSRAAGVTRWVAVA